MDATPWQHYRSSELPQAGPLAPDFGADGRHSPSRILKGFTMSRSSRSRAVLILFGTILAAFPAAAQDTLGATSGSRPAESKAAGQWTDPPAKAEKPATNAAAPKPMATPAKIDEPAVARRPEARAPRRMAKLRRAQIRTVASRTRPARVAVVREVDRPSRRVAARISVPPRFVRGPVARNCAPSTASSRPMLRPRPITSSAGSARRATDRAISACRRTIRPIAPSGCARAVVSSCAGAGREVRRAWWSIHRRRSIRSVRSSAPSPPSREGRGRRAP